MGRFLVLCLVFLSLLSFPGHACALDITGEVWLNAFASAENPASGPPKSPSDPNIPVPADAAFKVTDINFDSLRFKIPQNVTFNEFLNITDPVKQWTIPKGSTFDPGVPMFIGMNGKEGIFFKFSWPLFLQAGALPVTITHDDGFYFFTSDGQIINESKPVYEKTPAITTFDLNVPSNGEYTFTIYYGAINDSDDHVLIFRTPEPGSLLMLGLGILGIGVLRRRN
jgi:hypothetical protein